MSSDKDHVFINSLVEFLEACEENSPIIMDGEAYKSIIDTLKKQADATNDKNTRAALEKLINDLAEPVLSALNTLNEQETKNDDTLTINGAVEMSESIRSQLLKTVKDDTNQKKQLRSIIPDTAVINNSKLALEIIDNFVDGGNIPILVSKKTTRKKSHKEFEIIASMAYEGPNLKISGRQPYTAYDRAVLNAICSLWQAGNTAFTPAMVYLAMNGLSGSNEGGKHVSPQAIGAVTRSIEKQRVTRLTIDASDQLDHYQDISSVKFDQMMLSVDGVEMTAQNGKKVKAYAFTNPNRPPVLYEYSQRIGQVLSVSPRLLNSTEYIRTTEEVIVIREYLIRRIEGMKGENNLKSNRIRYESIYKEISLDVSTLSENALKDKTRKIRNNTRELLKHFQAENYIKSYSEYKNGRTIAGIEINL